MKKKQFIYLIGLYDKCTFEKKQKYVWYYIEFNILTPDSRIPYAQIMFFLINWNKVIIIKIFMCTLLIFIWKKNKEHYKLNNFQYIKR